jgi:hypothetical protein
MGLDEALVGLGDVHQSFPRRPEWVAFDRDRLLVGLINFAVTGANLRRVTRNCSAECLAVGYG